MAGETPLPLINGKCPKKFKFLSGKYLATFMIWSIHGRFLAKSCTFCKATSIVLNPLITRAENVQIWTQNFDIRGQKSFVFILNRNFFNRTYHHYYRRSYHCALYPPPQKDQFLRYGLFSGAHPRFWPLLKSSVTQGQLPVILVRYQWKNKNFNGGGRYFGSSKIFLFSEFCFPMSETWHGPKLVPRHNRS